MILCCRSAAPGCSTTDSRIVCPAWTPWHRISRGRSQEVQLGTETNSAYFFRSLADALPALSLRRHPPSGPLATCSASHEVALTHCWCDDRSSLSCTWFDSRGVRVIIAICVCEGLLSMCPGSRSGSSVKPFSFSSLHLTVFGVLGGGNRIEATWTVHNFIKCAKAMKKRGPAYYFVLTVASFLHSYTCMQNVL